MSHARTQIRDEAIALLRYEKISWSAALAGRIEPSRQMWPYLLVYSDSDKVIGHTVDAPMYLEREMSLNIVGKLKMPGNCDGESIENSMDALAAKVEEILTSNSMREGMNTVTLSLASIDTNLMVTDEDKVDHGEVHMVFTVEYQTMEGEPEVLI